MLLPGVMQLEKFWVKGFRSLRDVTLDGLGSFNVFYGPNGSGKSNLLDALQTLFYLMPLAVNTAYGPPDERLSFREAGRRASEWIGDDDFFARADTNRIELGAVINSPAGSGVSFAGRPVDRVEIEVQLQRTAPGEFDLRFTRLFVNGQKPGLPFTDPDLRELLRAFVPLAFTHLGVSRTLVVNGFRDGLATPPRVVGTIPDGEVVRELFAAKNAKDRQVRKRFDQMQDFMEKTLGRGRFDVYMDQESGKLELREALPEPNPRGLDIRVDRAGHGVVQLYAIVASILLAGGGLVAVEEPEAHMHAPTLGRELRSLFQRLVEEGRIHQLFIATHSNLFDLDPSGYWDVSLVDGETHAERKPLHEIDRLHLYEPGPAKHALAQLLQYSPGEEVVFRRPDGTPVTACEMLRLLQEDDATALDFLRNLHGAALRIVRLDARRAGSAA